VVSLISAQFSCLIVGQDDFRWVTYAFVDSDLDDEDSDEEGSEYLEDPICAAPVDANRPFWRAREYFLQVFELRVMQIQRKWQSVIREVERSIGQYVRLTSFLCIPMTCEKTIGPLRGTFDFLFRVFNRV
jgi:hypothetical protein